MSPRDRPRAVIVGSPPMFRGTTLPGRDIEMQIIKYFPGVAMFIEKPIATGPATEIDEVFKVSKHINDAKVICSVGSVAGRFCNFFNDVHWTRHRYMLRYLKAVQMMKKIIEENNLTVMSTIARYACAYQAVAKPDWWDKSKRSVFFSYMRYGMSRALSPSCYLVQVPSSNKAPTSVIYRATLVAKSISPPSMRILSSGTRMLGSCPRCPLTRARSRQKTGSRG